MIDINLLKAENEKIYQAIISQYKMANNEASQYNDSVKNMKLKENTTKAIAQARQLKKTFDKQIMDALTANKIEAETEITRNETPEEWTKENSSKLTFLEMQRNNRLLQTNMVLSSGHVQSIESHLDKNIKDTEVRNLIDSFISGKIQTNINTPIDKNIDNSEKIPAVSVNNKEIYRSIITKLDNAKITPLNEIEAMLGQARINQATIDTVDTSLFSHIITQDFPQGEYFTDKKDFFN